MADQEPEQVLTVEQLRAALEGKDPAAEVFVGIFDDDGQTAQGWSNPITGVDDGDGGVVLLRRLMIGETINAVEPE